MKFTKNVSRRRSHRRGHSRRPLLEPLENRWMLATFMVDSSSDNISDDGLYTLRERILEANQTPGPDTILFADHLVGESISLMPPSTSDPDSPLAGELTVTDELWIRGPGAGALTIDAHGSSRILRMNNADVMISGLTLTGGNIIDNVGAGETFDGRGGALYNDGGRLTLHSVIVKGNRAHVHGGGIYNVSRNGDIATLIVTGSIIADNVTSTGDGAGLYNLRGEVQISESTIIGNLASSNSSDGAGLMSVEGQTVIRSSTIAGNEAGAHGGGAVSLEGSIEIIDSTIGGTEESEGNLAGTAGAGLSAIGTDLFVYGSTFSGNQSAIGGGIHAGPRTNGATTTATIANSTISGNSATEKGGGLHLEAEFAEIVSSTIAYNTAGDGGGIFIANDPNGDNRDVELHNTIIAENENEAGRDDIAGQVCTSPEPAAPEGSCRFASSYNLVSDVASAGGMTSDPPGSQSPRHNLVGSDPLLLPLDFYGGPTMTHALQLEGDDNSPALDAGFWTFLILKDRTRVGVNEGPLSSATDQRGVARSSGVGNDFIDIGAYELDHTITRRSGVRSFDVVDHSQLDAGAANIADDIFLGATLDLPEWSIGGFDGTNTGFQATVDPHPIRVGIETGYSLDKGSIDTHYDAELAISFEDPTSIGKTRIEELVTYDHAEFTTSPDLNVGAYLDFVAELGADIEFLACILGECDDGGLELPVDLGGEIIAVNRDNDGELRMMGQPVLPGAEALRDAVPQQTFPDLPAKEGKLYENKKLRIDYNVDLEDCTAGAEGTGCRAELDLTIKQKQTRTKRTIGFGSAALKFPKLDSLHDNLPGLDGVLSASSDGNRLGDDDPPPWDQEITDLPNSFLGAAALQVGALAGGVLTTQKIDLGIASLEFTPASLEMGPTMYVEQQADVVPLNEITYRFDRPVNVYVAGSDSPQLVREVTLPVDQWLDIGFDGSVVEVTPEWHFGLDLHNQIDLVTELKGLLTILDIGIDLDGAIEAVLETIGLDTDALDPDPLHQSELFDLDLPPIHILNEVIPLLRESVMLDPFVIGESFEPSLVVTRRDDGGAGSLRSAVLNANLLAEEAANDSKVTAPDTYAIHLDAGSYVLDLSNVDDSENGGDLDIGDPDNQTETNITIVGAGADHTFISAEGLFDRIFDVHSGASLNLVGVTLLGGHPDSSGDDGDDGGSIRNQGSVTLEDVAIRGASTLVGTEGLGGAIYNASGAELSMTGGMIQSSAAYLGGAIYNAGDATIKLSTIGPRGLAKNDVGNEDRTNFFLPNCTTAFCNRASVNGGGIYNHATGSLTLASSTVSDNYSQYGGGLYNLGDVTIQGSTFSANNTTGNDGGGIYSSGHVAVTNSTFSMNRAAGGNGGAIFHDGTNSQGDGLAILHVTVFGNTAESGRGGGVFVAAGSASIENSIIANNIAEDLQNTNLPLLPRDGNYVGNEPLLAPLGNYGGATLTHALKPGSPAISLANPDLFPRDENDELLPDQRGVSWMTADAGSVAFTATEITVSADGSTGPLSLRQAITIFNVQGNVDSDGDGDLDDEVNTIHLQPGTYSLSEAEFLSLTDNPQQGDLDVAGQRLRLVGAGAVETIIDASAINDRVLDVHAGATLSIEGITIRGGHASSDESGGGIRNAGSLSLAEVIVTANRATTGGGIFNAEEALLVVDASMISENRSQWGGGVHNQGTLDVTSSSLIANEAVGGDGHDGERNVVDGGGEGGGGGGGGAGIGGGLFNEGGAVTLTNTTLARNTATGGRGGNGVDNAQRRPYSDGGDGGGPNAGRGGTIRYETRYAEEGGFGSGGGGGNSAFDMDQLQPGGSGGFGGGGGGGGAHTPNIAGKDPILVGAGGEAGEHAGAGGQGTRGPDTRNPDLPRGNTSAGGGGGGGAGLGAGIFTSNATRDDQTLREGTITILNSTVFDNHAEGGAGGLGGRYVDPDAPQVMGEPAEPGDGGQGAGGGIYVHSGTAALGNTIVAGNQADAAPDDFGNFASDGGNLIGVDPRLSSLRRAGVTLFAPPLSDSPAINHGNTDLVTALDRDGRGDVRLKDGVVDSGAVEVFDVVEEFTATEFSDVLGEPSLRQLILDTNAMRGPQIIYLKEGVYTLTIPAATLSDPMGAAEGDLDIHDDVTIIGDGPGATIIDASGLGDRVFDIFAGNNFHLQGVTLTGGSPHPDDNNLGSGGTIWNWGTATLEDVEITASTAIHGGAIHNNGPLTIINSVLHDNEAVELGGAIFGYVHVVNSTISNNRARQGAGIYGDEIQVAPAGSLTNVTITENVATELGGGIVNALERDFSIQSTIVAGNSAPAAPDVEGAWNSLGYNLFGATAPPSQNPTDISVANPRLGPLQDNGGPTMTHALLPGSPAIDMGDTSAVAGMDDTPELDQRGGAFARIADGDGDGVARIDIGAFEVQSLQPEPLTGDYNGNGRVEQADLDLVLLHWGQGFDELPDAWVHQRPTEGIIDQAELDAVLLNWGVSGAVVNAYTAAATPQPLREEPGPLSVESPSLALTRTGSTDTSPNLQAIDIAFSDEEGREYDIAPLAHASAAW